jgi:hypothetical protein
MRTIYLRNVPDEVAERLERLARKTGMSLNAFVVHELSEASRRADAAALLEALPDLPVSTQELVAALATERAEH